MRGVAFPFQAERGGVFWRVRNYLAEGRCTAPLMLEQDGVADFEAETALSVCELELP